MSLNNSILTAGFTFGSIYLFARHYEFTTKTLHNNNRYVFDIINGSVLALSGSIYVYMFYRCVIKND
jgi:hypothetical protein